VTYGERAELFIWALGIYHLSRHCTRQYSQNTFLNDRDYQAYLEQLGRYRKRFGVTVYAYCLMSNHVHLLVETGSEPVLRLVQGLQQSYTQYFNRKHHKVGHMFQGLCGLPDLTPPGERPTRAVMRVPRTTIPLLICGTPAHSVSEFNKRHG
jgi:REP element-mobilizing transposase RayT